MAHRLTSTTTVSIRSPHKSKGRREWPPSEARSKRVSIRSPHKSKGRPQLPEPEREIADVSIRSPHKSKGRPSAAMISWAQGLFQSAPLTKARGDSERVPAGTTRYSFNPLPSQKQGETAAVLVGDRPVEVSIRSPHKSKGRPKSKGQPKHYCSVSIRSPHKSKGRPPLPSLFWTHTAFQSAPLTKARGDIHGLRSAGTTLLFQSAPLTKARGDLEALARACSVDCFNPLPSQKQGETATFGWFRGVR